jgi:hypothetical protein
MKNEIEITDKTYTLSPDKSYFNSKGFVLSAFLPAEATENPYQYTAFDLTQMIDNEVVNAVLVFMKKKDDNGDDLSGSDDDTNEVNNSFDLKSLVKLTGLPGLKDFEAINDDTLVILMHDCAEDMPYKVECAEKVYELISSIKTNIANYGNFQTSLDVMNGGPKKTGMSRIPKH